MKKVLSVLVLISLAYLSLAQVVTPFTVRKTITQKGGILYLSNTASKAVPANIVQNEMPPSGTGYDNNFTNGYVDIDSDTSTWMSSSDQLNLPTCSEISWAGLYWGADCSSGDENFATRNQVKIKVNNGPYINLTADYLKDNTVAYRTYHCFKDVTSILQSNGLTDVYTVANVATDIGGKNLFGGWTLVVVFKNNLLTMRNLTVFDGLANVSAGSSPTVDIPISGFQTPLSGPVNFELGLVVYDGDRSLTGDQLLFKGGTSFINLSDALHPSTDMFNSTIARNGTLTALRNPNFNNTLGYDANIFSPNNSTKNYIGNNAISATIRQTTGGETFLTQVVTSAIDVYEPDLRSAVRVRNLNHPYAATATPGDTLEYIVNGLNIGSDPSINTYITDTIEGNAQFVPGSIRITSGPNSGIKTDAASDDQAEYISATKTVRVRIGTNANNFNGGLVLNSPTGTDSTQFKFKVTVSSDCVYLACDSIIDNSAFITGTGNVSGNVFNNASNPGVFNAYGCPISGTTKSPIGTGGCSAPGATINTPVCLGGNINLSTSLSPSATYLWTGPNSFTSALRQPTLTGVSAVNAGTYIANVFINGTGCHFVFPLNANLTIANAGADQTGTLTCGLTTLSLSANNPVGSTGTWSIVTGTGGSFGSGNTATTNVANSTFNGIAGNSYTLRWSLSSGSCPTTTDDVNITFQSAASTAVLSGTSIPCASELAVTLTGGASPFNITVSNGVGQLNNYSSGTHFTVNPNSTTTYSLVSVTGANGCVATALSGNATITVNSNMGSGTIIPTNPPSGTVATTGEFYPTIASTAGGTYNWSNPNNALTSNTVYASVNFTGNSNLQSQYLYLTGFFTSTTIPSAAVIDGIKVKLRKHATGNITDSRVQLYNGSSQGTAKTLSGNWSTTDQDYFYGTATDIWGATLTASMVSNSNFGLRIRVNGNTTTTAYIDYATMIVYYHIGNNTYCDYVNNAGFAVSGYSNATSYIWTPPTGASIVSGQGTSSVVVDFNGAGQSGNYAILVTPSNGCVNGAPATYNIPVSDCANSSLSILGNVYWDINGSVAPQKVDGTGIGTAKGSQLYVTLVNTSNNNFVATTSVSANGTYVFNPVTSNKTYQITLSTVNYASGTNPSTVLPVGVYYNGEINNVITNSLTGNDGSTNGKVTVASFNTNNETNVNFGLKILTPPVASNDAASTNEDTPVTVSVTTNDNDVDGTIAVNTITLTSTTNNGTWTANSSGIVSYTPALNFNGLASVTYSVKDNDAQISNTATITITVNPVNDPPRGLASSVTTNQNTSYTFSAANFNYSDVESNTLTAISLASLPTTGTLYYNGSAATNALTIPASSISLLSFMPLTNQFASPYTNFTFKVNDVDPGTIAGTMTINVLHVNVAPLAINDVISTSQNTVVSFNVLSNDINVDGTLVNGSVDLDPLSPLQQTSLIMPGQGTFAVNNAGVVSFTPLAAFYGNTSPVLYTVANSLSLTSNNATILVTVIPYGAPTAVNDATVTNENTSVTFNVTNNDYDDGSINVSRVDFDPVTAGYQQSYYVSGKGQFYADNLGNVTFSPDWNFFGVVTASYTVKDNLNLTSNLAQITVTVNWVNQPPFATDDFISTNEDTPVTFSAVTNDYDVDGTIDNTSIDLDLGTPGRQTTYTISGQGVFSADNSGNITFTPALDYNGTVTPKGYVVKDNLGSISDSAIVNIVVVPVNDAPQAVNDVAYTSAVTTTGSVSFKVIANDIDIDGIIDSISVDLDPATSGIQNAFSVPGEGNYTVDNSGTLTFYYTFATPVGTCTPIRYVVNDNSSALSNTASITVYILPLGTPIALNDTIYTNEDTAVNFNISSNDNDDNGVDPASISLLGPLATASGTWAITDVLTMPGFISFTPTANFNGTVSMTYTVNDFDPLTSNVATILLNVLPVNDAPSFSMGANQSVCENSGVQILNTWAGSILTGPANEAAQSLTFSVLNNNNLLFNGQPTVDASGNLSFSSASNMNGVASVSVVLQDDGGTANSGINTSSVQVFTITVNATPSISSVTSNARCDAGTLSIGATASNGVLNWYDVNLGGTSLGTGTVFNPSVTSTFVYYVDASFAGCTSTRSAVTATVNSSPSISLTSSSASVCAGSSANLVVAGASNYTWYPGAVSGSSISVNPSATTIYTVTGTDAVACSDTQYLTLAVNASPTITALSSATAICESASAVLSAAGASTYTWYPGAISGTNITVSPLATTIYTITGLDASSCSASATLALTVNANPTLTALSTTSAICSSGSANLSATGALTYTWMPGNLTGSLVSVSPLANTIYTLNGTNANACSSSATLALQVNNTPILMASAGSTAICENNSTTLTAGGALNYTWNPGNLVGSSVTVTPLASTVYTLTGSNASGCSETITLNLVVNANPTVTAVSSASAICANTSATLSASGAQTYDWNAGAFTTSVITVNPLSTTVYTLTGTNASGCSQSTTLSLQVNANPTLLAMASASAICANGTASLMVSGANSYTWSPAASNATMLTVSPLNTMTYSVSGTNLNGCVATATLDLIVNANPTLIATASGSAICAGNSSTLSAIGALNYTWTPGNINAATIVVSPTTTTTYTVWAENASACSSNTIITLNVTANPVIAASASASLICNGASASLSASGAQSYTWMPGNLSGSLISVNPLANTVYTVYGTNATGCESSATVSLSVSLNPTLSLVSNPNTICAGESASISATGALSYTWNPGALTASLITVTPVTTTVYSLTAANAAGCTTTATYSLVVNANPTLTALTSNTAVCAGQSATLIAAGAQTYTWMPGAFTSTSVAVTPVSTTSYTLSGTNASGCTASTSILIGVNATPTLVLNASSTSVCVGATSSLTASGANTYVWNPGALSGSMIAVSPAVTTVYTVTGTNATTCFDTKTISITVSATPTLSAVSSATAVCDGQSATLTATGANSYTWNPGALSASMVTVNPGATTNYTLIGQNTSACTSSVSLTLVVNANPTLVASANTTAICNGGTLSLNASGAQSYTWNPGAITSASATVSPASSVIYTVSGTNASGCNNSGTVAIAVNALPVVTISIPSATVCANTVLNLSATGANSYTWNPGNLTGSSVSATITANTVFTLQSASNQACEVTNTLAVYINNCPVTLNDSLTTIENTPVSGDASGNDTNTGGGSFTAGSPTNGGGSFYMDPTSGQYTYTPANGFTGTTTVSYTLCNGSPVVCSTAQITFTVFPGLTAVPDFIATNPGISTTGSLTTNDFGVVSGAVYSVSITQPTAGAGTLIINPANGQYTFIPAPGYTGISSASYTICNLSVNPIVCSTATINIVVANLPIAVNDVTTTMQGMSVSGNASLNDTGAESALNPSFTASLLTAGAGTFVMDAASGNYTFIPASGFTGTATAAYTLCNVNSPPCSSASISLIVYPTLLAMPDVIYGNPNTSVSGTLTLNDAGIVASANYSVSLSVLAASEGTMIVNAATGEYTFTPSASFSGSTATTYTICNISVMPQYCSNTSIQLFIGKAQMAATKNVRSTKKISAGTYQTVFEFKLSNIGTANANNVQVTDDLLKAFPSPISFTVAGLSAEMPLETNTNYNGSLVVALLSGTNTLAPLQSAALTLTVNYNPNANSFSQLSNIALATSALLPDPSGNGVHNSYDTTNSGSSADPNGNGDPNELGENTPALFGQQIAVSKSALPSIAIAKGTSQTTFIFQVENIGVVKATNIELIDNLNQAFPSPLTYTVIEKTSGALLSLNANFNGNSVTNLLAGNNSLLPGAKESITLTVNYRMNGTNYSSLFNTATANTKDASGKVLSSDISQTGNNCDPNDNGNPNEAGENELTYFVPALDSAEAEFSIPQGFSPNNDGVNDVFVIRGISTYPDNELTIFNRWGNIVYKKKAYDNTWNGKASEGMHFGSEDLPEGTYFYVLDIGTGKPHKGYIYLNRAVK